MEILGKLLGSTARVKIMRLFLLNKEGIFDIKDIEKRSLVRADVIRKELRLLESVGFVKKKATGYYFNYNFKYEKEFSALLISSDSLNTDGISSVFKKVGKIKLLVVSGVFIKNKDSRLDLLIVGDNMKRNKIEDGIKKLEAEIGCEISYAVFDYQEFIYRLNMYDKLIRDILDFPHRVLIQAKELSTQSLKKS